MAGIKLSRPRAEIYIPDGKTALNALRRTTHLGVAAHQDDLEIMAAQGILECFGRRDQWFCGVVVTDGAGSPRSGAYARLSDTQMNEVRRQEQKNAALVGKYGALALLDYPSKLIKNPAGKSVISDLKTLLLATRPSVVYTHNLADKHPTHVAVALRLLSACRALPKAARPVKVIGCEVWRDLDWLADPFKVVMALDGQESLQQALLGVFDSQVAGGKRYDLAAMGRRRANATYLESHGVDRHAGLIFGMDLTPLIRDNAPSPRALALKHIQDFAQDVQNRIDSLLGRP